MTTRSRLITTVFRPDVWFVMPPACNVVFPEECTNVSYSRQMMRETTRLELQTFAGILAAPGGTDISNQLIQQYYFAPALSGAGGPTLPDKLGKPKTKNDAGESLTEISGDPLTNVMYTHEKFTGIIPKIERIPDTAFYAALSANEELGNAAVTRPEDVPTVEQYAQRVALFNFLRNRYMARQASVAGKFMPRLVAGFPALVVNRPKETDTDDPTHFVGMITNVSHTLNQDGGTTSFALSYARPHTIASEEETFLQFLQALDASTPVIDKTTTYGASAADSADIRRINAQLVQIASELTDEGIDPIANLYLPLSQGDYFSPAGRNPDLIQAGLTPTVFSATIVLMREQIDLETPVTVAELFENELGDPLLGLAFRSYFDIQETDKAVETEKEYAARKGVSVTDPVPDFASADGNTYPVVLSIYIKQDAKTVKKSFEEIITPPWFSDSYQNSAIGTYYKRLLGCDSMGSQFGSDNSSVEAAARAVVSAYSDLDNVKSNAGDPKFVYLNTQREIPTQAEVLEFHRFVAVDGTKAQLYGLDESGGGVIEDNTGHIARNRVSTGDELALEGAASLDPRQERYTAVKSYHDQLLGRRAFRG